MKYDPHKKHRLLMATLAFLIVAVTAGFVTAFLTPPLADYQQLVGQWQRADGGYVLDIQNAPPSGKLQAVYLNPKPVNVSKAQAKTNSEQIELFVELMDWYYPGNYYTLTYDRQMDILVGTYHHLGIEQNFEVYFSRKPESN